MQTVKNMASPLGAMWHRPQLATTPASQIKISSTLAQKRTEQHPVTKLFETEFLMFLAKTDGEKMLISWSMADSCPSFERTTESKAQMRLKLQMSWSLL